MACQSLDNDEILNVRWATEDPSPTSKVTETRWLEEVGREAIQARIDPRILPASMGLLSADAPEGLKCFAEIRKRIGGPPVATAKTMATPVGILLGDYGNDEDD